MKRCLACRISGDGKWICRAYSQRKSEETIPTRFKVSETNEKSCLYVEKKHPFLLMVFREAKHRDDSTL